MSQRLQGWKEIAAYLDRSVATAQRWERELGLPVHRLGDPDESSPRQSVYAFADEIDTWFRESSQRTPEEAPESPADSTSGEREPSRDRGYRGEELTTSPIRSRLRGAAIGAMATASLIIFGVVVYALRTGGSALEPTAALLRGGVEFTAYDSSGLELWTLVLPEYSDAFDGDGEPMWRVADFDGDGRNEVFLARKSGSEADGLFMYDGDGSLLWKRSVGLEIEIDGKLFPDGFTLWDVDFARTSDGGIEIVAFARHRPDYPFLVTSHDHEGRTLGRYLHTGYLFDNELADLDGDGSDEIVFAGYNNHLETGVVGALAVPRGDSVSPGPETVPPGWHEQAELGYLVLPQTRTARALGVPSWASQIQRSGDHFAVEMNFSDRSNLHERAYLLDRRLRLTRVILTDSFRALHARLRAEGRIAFPFAAEEERARQLRYLVDHIGPRPAESGDG